jgi:hypothetical protein
MSLHFAVKWLSKSSDAVSNHTFTICGACREAGEAGGVAGGVWLLVEILVVMIDLLRMSFDKPSIGLLLLFSLKGT